MFGKARSASRIPATVHHYQQLPAAETKPKQPEILDSIEDTVVRVDTMGGGPEGRCTTLMTHTDVAA
jgi:hypothetical protein